MVLGSNGARIYKTSTPRCEERPVAVFRGGALCVFCFLNAFSMLLNRRRFIAKIDGEGHPFKRHSVSKTVTKSEICYPRNSAVKPGILTV